MSLHPITKHRLREPIRAQNVQVRLLDLASPEREEVLALLNAHHYLRAPSLIGRHLIYAIEIGKYCLGAMCFSDACRQLAPRDRFLGWAAVRREQRVGFVIQNDRFLLLPGVSGNNVASRALGLCVRRVADDWKGAFKVPVLVAETFVDPARFSGRCYQAANWIRVGESQGYSQDGDRYRYHGQPKTVWLCPLQPHAYDILRSAVLPDELVPFERPPRPTTVKRALSPERIDSLLDALRQVADPRRRRGKRHRVSTCLALVIMGLAAGCEALRGCLTFAQTLDKRQLQSLGIYRHPRTKKLMLPSYPSLCRIIAALDPVEVEEAIQRWQVQAHGLPSVLAIDGKALRGSLAHGESEGHVVVTAFSHDPDTPFFSRPWSTRRDMNAKVPALF